MSVPNDPSKHSKRFDKHLGFKSLLQWNLCKTHLDFQLRHLCSFLSFKIHLNWDRVSVLGMFSDFFSAFHCSILLKSSLVHHIFSVSGNCLIWMYLFIFVCLFSQSYNSLREILDTSLTYTSREIIYIKPVTVTAEMYMTHAHWLSPSLDKNDYVLVTIC